MDLWLKPEIAKALYLLEETEARGASHPGTPNYLSNCKTVFLWPVLEGLWSKIRAVLLQGLAQEPQDARKPGNRHRHGHCYRHWPCHRFLPSPRPQATAQPQATLQPLATAQPQATLQPQAMAQQQATAQPQATARLALRVQPALSWSKNCRGEA
jgi:hypothetical protein